MCKVGVLYRCDELEGGTNIYMYTAKGGWLLCVARKISYDECVNEAKTSGRRGKIVSEEAAKEHIERIGWEAIR